MINTIVMSNLTMLQFHHFQRHALVYPPNYILYLQKLIYLLLWIHLFLIQKTTFLLNHHKQHLHLPSDFPIHIERWKKIKDFIHTTSMNLPTTIDWPDIGSSPINEYNTKGLFDIAFPTLFPNKDALPHQSHIKNISLYTYAVHLMRYHDN